MKRIEHPPLSIVWRRRRGGRHDNYGSVRTAHPDSRSGGHRQTTGSQPRMFDGLPNLRLPEAPASGTRRHYENNPTTQQLHRRSFISLQQPPAAPLAGPRTARPRHSQAPRRAFSRGWHRAPRSPRRTHPRVPRRAMNRLCASVSVLGVLSGAVVRVVPVLFVRDLFVH